MHWNNTESKYKTAVGMLSFSLFTVVSSISETMIHCSESFRAEPSSSYSDTGSAGEGWGGVKPAKQ